LSGSFAPQNPSLRHPFSQASAFIFIRSRISNLLKLSRYTVLSPPPSMARIILVLDVAFASQSASLLRQVLSPSFPTSGMRDYTAKRSTPTSRRIFTLLFLGSTLPFSFFSDAIRHSAKRLSGPAFCEVLILSSLPFVVFSLYPFPCILPSPGEATISFGSGASPSLRAYIFLVVIFPAFRGRGQLCRM